MCVTTSYILSLLERCIEEIYNDTVGIESRWKDAANLYAALYKVHHTQDVLYSKEHPEDLRYLRQYECI